MPLGFKGSAPCLVLLAKERSNLLAEYLSVAQQRVGVVAAELGQVTIVSYLAVPAGIHQHGTQLLVHFAGFDEVAVEQSDHSGVFAALELVEGE